MEKGDFLDIGDNDPDATPVKQDMTITELLNKYLKEETPKKAKGNTDEVRARAVKKALGAFSMHTLTSARITQYKRDRLLVRAPQTVLHELNILHRAYVVASEEWGVKLNRPIPKTSKPELPPGRSNRIPPDVVTKIIQGSGSAEMSGIITLAVETAMRRGELLNLKVEDINFERKSLYIPRTKTDTPRTIPLTTEALKVLKAYKDQESGPVFTLAAYSVSQAFRRAVKRIEMPQLRFHDLRHEAISRLFEKGLNVIEVSRISGHKTLSQLDRYTHLDVSNLGKKLRSRKAT